MTYIPLNIRNAQKSNPKPIYLIANTLPIELPNMTTGRQNSLRQTFDFITQTNKK